MGQRNEKEALVDGIAKFDAEIGQSIANTSLHLRTLATVSLVTTHADVSRMVT